MNPQDFYIFDPQGYMTQFYAPCPILLTEAYRGNSTRRLLYGKYDSFEFPLVLQQEKSYGGKKMTDFLNTGWLHFSPISDKILNLLITNNITGWKTYPIRVYDKFGNEVPGYHGFSITGRCKDVDLSLLQKKVDYQYIKDGPVYQYYKGFPLDLSTWDGSDLFLLSGTGYQFLTKKVYEIFKKNKITNIEYKKVSDMIIMEDTFSLLQNKEFKYVESYYW